MPPHIEKEESALFPMAEQMMGKEEWGEVRALWNQARAAASTE
jgi:hemerythrin-like domain-containing protein